MASARALAATLSGLALALSLAACSSSDTAQSTKEYCSSSEATQAEVAELKTLVTSGSATMEDVQSQVDVIKDSSKTALDDAGGLADSVKAEIKAADQAFEEELAAIPDDATLSEALTAYQAAIKNWDAAVAAIRADVGC